MKSAQYCPVRDFNNACMASIVAVNEWYFSAILNDFADGLTKIYLAGLAGGLEWLTVRLKTHYIELLVMHVCCQLINKNCNGRLTLGERDEYGIWI